jgi:hypothetical protein
MNGTTPKLAGLIAATALAFAAPAAYATPALHSHGKTVRHTAHTQTTKVEPSNPNTGNCAAEADYVYAGAQCDPVEGASAGAGAGAVTASALKTITVSPSDPTAWNCSLEYEYVYAGAQCAHATSIDTAGTVLAG